MNYIDNFKCWEKYFVNNKEIYSELKKISVNEDEIAERFSSELEFGTAGLRGIMGLGTNRLNIYTVRKATQGLANYLIDIYKSPSVVISFDSRLNSDIFAREASSVLAANGIKVYISKSLAPTPFLSFAVRELDCQAGIMITASHNPAEYNGYKCYGEDGAQMSTENTEKVYKYIKKIDIFKDVEFSCFEDELELNKIEFIPEKIYKDYTNQILSLSVNNKYPRKCDLSVTYTPLNGAGRSFVTDVLNRIGIKHLNIVKEQEEPNGNFPTCRYPNPETKEAFSLAIRDAVKNSSDIIIATDPDSDRLGVGVLHKGQYQILTGNQIGILMFNYIISQRKCSLPKNPVAIRTLVSSKMIDSIAKDYNCIVECVPTGFKYIGEKIKILEKNHLAESFIFGFEESNGYLSGIYTRDKDAVLAAMIICEMTSFYKNQGLTLIDVMYELNKKYGFYLEKTISFQFNGSNGLHIMRFIMENLRSTQTYTVNTLKVRCVNDYLKSESLNLLTGDKLSLDFPKLNIIEFIFDNNSSIIIRPSGTEPKLKMYVMAVGENAEETNLILKEIEDVFGGIIKKLS